MAKQRRKVAMPAGIRNKMMAAVSMLMVSSIMMVSSTYAWFTLSTAPEVKNISTTVAGNGSLEIALMPGSGLFSEIRSGFSSENNGGNVPVAEANNSWGNIIYLNDNESYGLATVNLNPAQLNVDTANNTKLLDNTKPLAIATYGYDGRVDEVLATTTLKSYSKTDKTFSSDDYGVRVIGEAESTSLTSTYGYAIDLAFRLNASSNTKSKLLLQTAEKQRIYNGDVSSSNAETLGGGSYMSINANNTGIDIKVLMDAIRVTFIQNYGLSGEVANATILGTARLDSTNAVKGATATTAKLYMEDTVTQNEETGISTATLKGDGGVLIEEMEDNKAVQVSAVVWLDGNAIKNASVAALKGALAQATLNLQFSTDAELKPANNNALFQGSAE